MFNDYLENLAPPSVDLFENGGPYKNRRPQFGRYATFVEDLKSFKEKYRNTENEVYVQHMIDSLVILLHNTKNLTGHNNPTLTKALHKIKL